MIFLKSPLTPLKALEISKFYHTIVKSKINRKRENHLILFSKINRQSMIEFLKNLLDKSFWTLIGCYGLYILYKIFSYFAGLKHAVNKEIYYQWFIENMMTVGAILGAAFLFKLCGKTRIASLILGFPATITMVTTIIIVTTWLFLALALILFGKS
jgi:hypothetical protein